MHDNNKIKNCSIYCQLKNCQHVIDKAVRNEHLTNTLK